MKGGDLSGAPVVEHSPHQPMFKDYSLATARGTVIKKKIVIREV
jgi:hypothetical protein